MKGIIIFMLGMSFAFLISGIVSRSVIRDGMSEAYSLGSKHMADICSSATDKLAKMEGKK